MNTVETLSVPTMMGTYPKTQPLKDGALASPVVHLDFAPVDTAQKAFKDVVRHEKYDVAELAIVTFLQAFEAGAPYVMLPFVMNGNFHHKSIVVRDDATFTASELAGRKVAMRAYTQTTPTWVRGILTDDYGVRLADVQWLSQEGAHVANYEEPEWVSRLESTLSLEAMLRAGEVDAIIAGGGLSGEPGIRPLIPSPKEAASAWNARTHAVPINHVVTVKRSFAQAHPEAVREVYRLLGEARDQAQQGAPQGAIDLQPAGFEKLAPALELAVRYAFEQRLITRHFTLEELYGPVLDILG
jgi:4,5-dihydroxyphthalate decarboxylase